MYDDSNTIVIRERQSRAYAKITGHFEKVLINWRGYGVIRELNDMTFIHYSIILEVTRKAHDMNIRTRWETLLDGYKNEQKRNKTTGIL